MAVYVVVLHPWREAPKGDLTLLLDPAKPRLHLGFLPADSEPATGDEVETAEILGDFTLHQSPDERVPAVAETVAKVLFKLKPDWLTGRLLELLNNIHGFGTSRNPRGPAARTGMDHPLAPLGLWGPSIDMVGREVRKGRFSSWDDLEERLEPVVYVPIAESVPQVLRDDILGVRTPRMLLREPL